MPDPKKMKNIFKGAKDKLHDAIKTTNATEDGAFEQNHQADRLNCGRLCTRYPNERGSYTDPLPRGTARHEVRERKHSSYGDYEECSNGWEQSISGTSLNRSQPPSADEPPKFMWRIGPFAILSPKKMAQPSEKRGRHCSQSESHYFRNQEKEKSRRDLRVGSNSDDHEQENSDRGENRSPQRKTS